ncbi:MAG TPA: hypothetical protein VKM55_09900 [Candidatus Lokiarchaeia archaeon]|nr:hypothetical protein [Candidatus Lokiarchaeia archaeon]
MDATNNIAINEKGDLVISFETRKIQNIIASKQENMLLVPASDFKSLPLDTISDVICDTERNSIKKWILMVIGTNGKTYILGKKMRPIDAEEGRKALISYLFSGTSKTIVYLAEKVKILKCSTNEVYIEVNLLYNQKKIFYLWLFYFLVMIALTLALGMIFSSVSGSYNFAIVVSILSVPVMLCAGNLYYRGLFVRKRVLMSFMDKTISIERYSVRHERIMASKIIPVNTIKNLSLRTISSAAGTTYTILIALENRKKEKLITMNNFLSAQRLLNLLNNLVNMINKKQTPSSAKSIDNFLIYGRVDFYDLDSYNSYITNKRLTLRFSYS